MIKSANRDLYPYRCPPPVAPILTNAGATAFFIPAFIGAGIAIDYNRRKA